MKKPEFNIENVKAEVKGLSTIEENMKEALNFAVDLRSYYQGLIFQEEDIKLAKEEKANVNKLKAKIDNIRKEITKEYNKPLENFISISKEVVSTLSETYDFINNQVNSFELTKLEEKVSKLKDFFNEHLEFEIPALIDYISFEKSGINVTLSASMKSLKDQILEFISRLQSEMALIELEQYRDEIFNEYIKDFNFARAKLEILNRKMELDKIAQDRLKLEELEKEEEKIIEKVDEVIMPKEVEDTIYFSKMSMTLYDVSNVQLKELQKWLEERGIKYE